MPISVLLCGPFPEPVGGVSIHIERLQNHLNKRDYRVLCCDESPLKKDNIFNIRECNPVHYIRLLRSADIVHIHSAIHFFRFIHLLGAVIFRKRIVITIHSWRESPFFSSLWRMLFKISSVKLIFVSEAIKSEFRLAGDVCPAYINPDIDLEGELPEELTSWIEKIRAANYRLAVSNAYKLVLNNGQDLYGLDLCIDVAKRVDGLAFLFVVANSNCGEIRIERYRNEIDRAGMTDRFLIHEGAVSYIRLLSAADLSVRATNTDGDALSVRESLFIGCKTLASDAAYRPEGVIKFANRSVEDLETKIRSLICSGADTLAGPQLIDCTKVIGEVYQALLCGRGVQN